MIEMCGIEVGDDHPVLADTATHASTRVLGSPNDTRTSLLPDQTSVSLRPDHTSASIPPGKVCVPDDLYLPEDLDAPGGPRFVSEQDQWDAELDELLGRGRCSRVEDLEWEEWHGIDQDEAERALLRLDAPAWAFLPPGGDLAVALEETRPRTMSPMPLIELLKATTRQSGWTEALKVEAMASFYRQRQAEHAVSPRPAQYDANGRPIDPERSWYAEIGLALGLSEQTVARRVATALRLTSTLRATHTALKCGALTWGKALAISEATADLPEQAAQAVEAHVLKRAAAQTHKNLLESLRRQVAKHRAAKEADEHRAAVADRTCKIVPLANGMAGLWIVHTADKIQQIWVTIQAMATLAKRHTTTPANPAPASAAPANPAPANPAPASAAPADAAPASAAPADAAPANPASTSAAPAATTPTDTMPTGSASAGSASTSATSGDSAPADTTDATLPNTESPASHTTNTAPTPATPEALSTTNTTPATMARDTDTTSNTPETTSGTAGNSSRDVTREHPLSTPSRDITRERPPSSASRDTTSHRPPNDAAPVNRPADTGPPTAPPPAEPHLGTPNGTVITTRGDGAINHAPTTEQHRADTSADAISDRVTQTRTAGQRCTDPTADATANRVADTRTAEQRRADVTADLFEHILRNGLDWLGHRLPDQHRRRPHIEVVIPASTLLGLDDDPAELTGYGPIPADLARRIAADGTWRRLLTDPHNGTVLEASTTRHDPGALVSETLLARHPVCAWPGCNRTSRDCDRDHTTPFAQTGTTSLTGLAPYCEYHHVIKDTPAWGWTSTSHPDGSIKLTTPTGHRYTTDPPARGPITHRLHPSNTAPVAPSHDTGSVTPRSGDPHGQPRATDGPPPF
ncbi:hypothetical protein AB0F43_37205 [Kribbella sp. NPDC023972]|uniref:HNH endonuclease signature motif containing protein n=1 Tax=Kribbella sp. NPDC023972 TaxID=3154795 RepID=UPI00340DE9B9